MLKPLIFICLTIHTFKVHEYIHKRFPKSEIQEDMYSIKNKVLKSNPNYSLNIIYPNSIYARGVAERGLLAYACTECAPLILRYSTYYESLIDDTFTQFKNIKHCDLNQRLDEYNLYQLDKLLEN